MTFERLIVACSLAAQAALAAVDGPVPAPARASGSSSGATLPRTVDGAARGSSPHAVTLPDGGVLPVLEPGASTDSMRWRPAEPPATSRGPALEGSVAAREEYRFRESSAPAETSHEARVGLDVSVADVGHHLEGAASLDLFWTLARTASPGSNDPLATVFDGRNPFIDVYRLDAAWLGTGLVREVRLGRQQASHGRLGTFDGASVLLRPPASGLTVFAFGGRAEHFFEVAPTPTGLFDDWLASAGVGYRFGAPLRVEADARVASDRVLDATLAPTTATTASWGLTGWWRPADLAWVRLGARGLGGRFAEASATGRLELPGPRTGVDGRLLVQAVTLSELDELDNPLLLTLGESLPHARWRLDAHQGLGLGGGELALHVGWAGRHLLWDVERPFNRNSSRLFALLAARDLGVKGLSLSVSVERLGADALPLAGEGHLALCGDAVFERGRLRVAAGTRFDRFAYTYYQDVAETADVRVVYGEVRVPLFDWLSVRGRYSLELFDRTRKTFLVTLAEALPAPGGAP